MRSCYQRLARTATDEETLISPGAAGNMVVIRSFPFGCTTDHVDAVISTSSYREAGTCGVVWRRADSFGPPDGVGARSDIQDILDGAVAILLLEMSAAEFTDRHVFDQYRVYEGSGRLRGVRRDGLPAQELIERRRQWRSYVQSIGSWTG